VETVVAGWVAEEPALTVTEEAGLVGNRPRSQHDRPITGADRPKARGGPGPARTDEEIQIVFDRYKASFYRLYNRSCAITRP